MSFEGRLAVLQRMTTGELKAEWRSVMGGDPRSGNRPWLVKRLAWAIQAREYGGLSPEAERRIEELMPMALAWKPIGHRAFPKGNAPVSSTERDRLSPGTVITRKYLGRVLQLLVREDGGFELDGVIYASLTAAAQAATGSHWNGTLFWFGRPRDRKTA